MKRFSCICSRLSRLLLDFKQPLNAPLENKVIQQLPQGCTCRHSGISGSQPRSSQHAREHRDGNGWFDCAVQVILIVLTILSTR
jgi:hypothetical protein